MNGTGNPGCLFLKRRLLTTVANTATPRLAKLLGLGLPRPNPWRCIPRIGNPFGGVGACWGASGDDELLAQGATMHLGTGWGRGCQIYCVYPFRVGLKGNYKKQPPFRRLFSRGIPILIILRFGQVLKEALRSFWTLCFGEGRGLDVVPGQLMPEGPLRFWGSARRCPHLEPDRVVFQDPPGTSGSMLTRVNLRQKGYPPTDSMEVHRQFYRKTAFLLERGWVVHFYVSWWEGIWLFSHSSGEGLLQG